MTAITLTVVITLDGADATAKGEILTQIAAEGRLEPGILHILRRQMTARNDVGDWRIVRAMVTP